MQRPFVPSEPIYPDREPGRRDRALRRAWIDVDLGALRRNARRLRERAGVPIVAMVKADAYGVGMLPTARALGGTFIDEPVSANAEASWAFGVATLDEAATLRDAGCTSRILCTTPLASAELPNAHALDVRPALHRADDIVQWRAYGGGPWHLSIDTGMSRAGARWDDVARLVDVLRAHPPEGIFTHFHSAEVDDGSRAEQDVRFAAALCVLGDAVSADTLLHSDNSAAIAMRSAMRGAKRGASSAHLVRPGIGLYGAAITPALALEHVVHVRAAVVDLRDVHTGETVSYGASWRAPDTRYIATLSIGYADGYRRALSNRGEVLLHGHRVPVVGTVTMDMTMVDVTALGSRCAIGDVATLIGRDGNTLLSTDDVAARAGLSPYELLVGLRLRADRIYHASSFESHVD